MKKVAVIGSLFAIILVFFGIRQYANYAVKKGSSFMNQFENNNNKQQLNNKHESDEILTIYYSNSGATEKAAKYIHRQVSGDLVEMKLTPNYPDDYQQLAEVSKDQIDNNVHPRIDNLLDLSKYRVIFLGFPTWDHRPPMFINTFFETGHFNGQTVIPFTTSMSSGIDESASYLEKMGQNKKIDLQDGFRANNQTTIDKFIEQYQ